jgi:hypothetical protein
MSFKCATDSSPLLKDGTVLYAPHPIATSVIEPTNQCHVEVLQSGFPASRPLPCWCLAGVAAGLHHYATAAAEFCRVLLYVSVHTSTRSTQLQVLACIECVLAMSMTKRCYGAYCWMKLNKYVWFSLISTCEQPTGASVSGPSTVTRMATLLWRRAFSVSVRGNLSNNVSTYLNTTTNIVIR